VKAQRSRLRFSLVASRIADAFAKDEHPRDARFAKLHELKPLLSDRVDQPSINLGIGPYFHPLRVQPSEMRPELGNILINCRSRGGKGLWGTTEILTFEGPVVTNDIKRDYWDNTAGYRNRYGPVWRFDPTGKSGHRFDPTAGKTSEDDLYEIAKYLLYDPKDNQQVFTERAIKMLTQMLLGAVAEDIPKFLYIRDMVDFGPRFTAEKLHSIPGIGPRLANKFLDVPYEKVDWSSKFLNDCWATLSAKLYPLLLPNVLKSLSGSDFTAKQIIQNKYATLYLCWPEKKLTALAPLIRLVWSTLIDDTLAIYDDLKGEGCYDTFYNFDEAGRCPVPNLPDYTSTVAGRKMSFGILVQSPFQLEEHYGPFGASIIRDNCDTHIFHRPSSDETADKLESGLGERTEWYHSQTHHDKHTSEGMVEKSVSLMTAQEIRKLKDDEIIIRYRDLWPIKAWRMDLNMYPELVARTKISPPPLPTLPDLSEDCGARSDLQIRQSAPQFSTSDSCTYQSAATTIPATVYRRAWPQDAVRWNSPPC
jgi:type IV secretion system protein VirD4